MTARHASGVGTATWTCMPKTSSRRATYWSISTSARYRSRAVIFWCS